MRPFPLGYNRSLLENRPRSTFGRLVRDRRRFLALAISIVVLGMLFIGWRESRSTKPTIILIVTDDQRWDTLWAMPNVRRHLMGHGVTFTNAFVTTPLCCPSRASILSGQYAHTTGVWQNHGRFGGFDRFRDRSSIATWLHRAGYRTALFGKYLNGYRGTYVPPGWDRWLAFADRSDPKGLYYDYLMNNDGQLKRFRTEYSTGLLAREAVQHIRDTEGPLFLYFAPYAPHKPNTPAPGDRDAFSDLPPHRPPSYDEEDISDKPAWVHGLRRPKDWPRIERLIADQRVGTYRSLLAVDRAVAKIVDALRRTNRLSNSAIVFTSDNGTGWGEHRWRTKAAAYEESIRVPFVIRYDRLIDRPRRDKHLVLNLDVAGTLAEFGGTRAPGVEGRSLVPLLNGLSPRWRSDFLIEYGPSGVIDVPAYCAVRSERLSYVRYGSGEEELYDLSEDPYQLSNLVGEPNARPHLRKMRVRVRQLCHRPPPGMSLSRAPGE